MLKPLRFFLESADLPGDGVFTAEDLDYWARGCRDQLVELGIMQEVAPGRSVICNDCGEAECVVEPDIRPDPDTGKMVGMYCCPADHGVGVAFFDLDRFRQWRIHYLGIATWVAAITGAAHGTCEIVPDRIWFLGTVRQKNRTCELFLARGLTWPDAGQMIRQATRLQASASLIVLVPAQLPPLNLWDSVSPRMATLTEILQWDDQGPRLNLSQFFEQMDDRSDRQRVTPSQASVPPATAPLLTETESIILQAMAAQPGRAMQLADVMAAGGYGKQATRKCLDRLREHGFIAKPPGTTRQGDMITPVGMAFFENLAEQSMRAR